MEDENELGTLDERFVNMMIQVYNIMESASDEDDSETAERLSRLFVKYDLFDRPQSVAYNIVNKKSEWD